MSNRPTQPPRRIESTQSTTNTAIGRRHLLRGSVVAAMVGVVGCLDTPDTTSDDGSDGADDGPVAVVDAYLEAAEDDDLEAMSKRSHDLHPFDPQEWVEDGWEFEGGDGEEVPEYDADVRTEDGSVDDILELEAAEV